MTDQRVALVTGASRGLGAHVARRLARDGFAVAVNHRNSAADAARVVSAIEVDGGTARPFAADVTSEVAVNRLIHDIESELGKVCALVLNATGPQDPAPVDRLQWNQVAEQLDYFVKSPTLLLNAVLPHMTARGGGSIVHIVSDVVDLIPEGSAAYVCAKSAQRALARSWAKELGPLGINVNIVSPGWVPVERHAGVPEERRRAYAAAVPMRRLGVPADIAGAVSFLCSPDAEFLAGVDLTVNGGKTLQ